MDLTYKLIHRTRPSQQHKLQHRQARCKLCIQICYRKSTKSNKLHLFPPCAFENVKSQVLIFQNEIKILRMKSIEEEASLSFDFLLFTLGWWRAKISTSHTEYEGGTIEIETLLIFFEDYFLFIIKHSETFIIASEKLIGRFHSLVWSNI